MWLQCNQGMHAVPKTATCLPQLAIIRNMHEGYQSMEEAERAIGLQINSWTRLKKLVEIKHPRSHGWGVVWIFDHSSCHVTMPERIP